MSERTDLNKIIQSNITAQTKFPSLENFGIGAFVEEFTPERVPNLLNGRYKVYTSLAELVEDWTPETSVYRAAFGYFSNPVNPGRFVLLRKDVNETWPTALVNIDAVYTDWYGFECSTTDSDDRVSISQWVSGAIKQFFITTGNRNCYSEENEAKSGYWHSKIVTNIARFSSVREGYFNIQLNSEVNASEVQVSFVGSVSFEGTNGIADKVQTAIQSLGGAYANVKAYMGRNTLIIESDTQDADSKVIMTPGTSGTDLLGSLYFGSGVSFTGKVAETVEDGLMNRLLQTSNDRTVVYFTPLASDTEMTPENVVYAGLDISGQCFSRDPGSQTWAFKTPVTVPPTNLTGGQKNSLEANRVNYIMDIKGFRFTNGGVTGGMNIDGSYIDSRRGTDALSDTIQTDLLGLLVQNPGLGMENNSGLKMVEVTIQSSLLKFVFSGFLAPSTEDFPIVVTVPKKSDIPPAERAGRTVSGATWGAYENNKIQRIVVSGNISV